MSAAVYQIIDQIQHLDHEDRSLFDRLLEKLEENDWQAEARKARRQAGKLGLDQQAIDKTIERERYGA